MAYTKLISRHDKITIDGTDVSNSFSEFGYSSRARRRGRDRVLRDRHGRDAAGCHDRSVLG